MAGTKMAVLLLLLLAPSVAAVSRSETRYAANPIRKVVTMLQDMQKKVTEEGKREEELYHKFMCYCKNSGGDLDASIVAAQEKIESAGSEVQAKIERKAQTESDLKTHEASRAEAEETMATATALREKEASEFAKLKSDLETNIAAVGKAVAAIEKGVGGSFLQTSAASMVKSFAMERATLDDASRQELLAFLSGAQGEGYAPASGEITGILKTMGDEMSKDLADSTDSETAATTNFEALMAAKKKEVATLQGQIEVEMERIGRLGMEVAEFANDIEDTKEALAVDETFRAELETSCKTKSGEWEAIKMTRAEELVALSETINVLNDDDALDLFKKTLPGSSASFMQVQVTVASQKARALALIHAAAKMHKRPELDLIALALQGKAPGFGKVITMIDEMILNLKAEQSGDESKKQYCEAQLDEYEDKQKAEEQSIADSAKAVEEMEGAIVTLAAEIKALNEGITALDKSVVEATEQRKEQNEEFKALMQADSTAKEVLGWAKNRLNKFYNPKLYVAPPKAELSEEESITVNMGGTLAPTPAPGGIAGTGIGAAAAFVQVRAHTQDSKAAPPPPPETAGPYLKKGGESNGVIAMIDLLVKDLDKEMQEAEVAEKDAQSDYETMMADAGAKRAADAQLFTEKEGAKADNEEALETEQGKKAETEKELMGTAKYISGLHGECDWLLKYFDARKEARTSEIDSLSNAKAVLSGADFSLVQTSVSRRTGFLTKRQ
eukprot:CAMPEP_0203869096 /NCGR_PEP_ID=MMETSP0359-20131031/17506_1 /ASSEMBLY_ACC=CAM_ASM_000338 /TAXON_ID=268821 /ORGANISM="Scrippsiella Hangoei, Strain SHTV-5" /LENGTH=729 /DNA_ID=CAMNT_0050787649 /DNA_START=77 /DNA_END=2266 /DNA_ORIENTATION=+